MTNQEIIRVYEGLMTLKQDSDIRLPARVSFTIARNAKQLQSIVEDYATARFVALEKYGNRDPANPDTYIIPEKHQQTVFNELSALDNLDIDVNLMKIKLADIEKIELTVNTMDALYPLIEEEV